jgi:hypothetical protein
MKIKTSETYCAVTVCCYAIAAVFFHFVFKLPYSSLYLIERGMAKSNTGIVGLNPTRGMYVYLRFFRVFVVLQLAALRRTYPPSIESYQLSVMFTVSDKF